ncbi:MAG: 50S ribosomal protein L24 [Chloroflexota bacterium]
MQRIKKGDTVEVIAGKDLGQRGAILRINTKDERVIVEQINMVKKHRKAQQAGNQQVPAGIIEKESPLAVSNVMLVCTQCGKKTRVGFRINEEGRKVRVCKQCKQDID